MCWFDRSSVAQYVPCRSDEDLSKMWICHVNLAVTEGDVNAVPTGWCTDSAHFIRIRWQAIFGEGFLKGEGLLVIDLPRPVGKTWDPYAILCVSDHRCNGRLKCGWRAERNLGKETSLHPALPASLIK